jgi:hypothetical protein
MDCPSVTAKSRATIQKAPNQPYPNTGPMAARNRSVRSGAPSVGKKRCTIPAGDQSAGPHPPTNLACESQLESGNLAGWTLELLW